MQGSVLGNAPAGQLGDLVSHMPHHIHLMGDQDDGQAQVAAQRVSSPSTW